MIVCCVEGCMEPAVTDAGGCCAFHVCRVPGCSNPRRMRVGRSGPKSVCRMHDKRRERKVDPETVGAGAWAKLKAAARRLSVAEDSGWSDRGIESAEEQLKRAAIGYRRAFRRARRAA